jgi:NAD(P)-dependent dehydrogenase (short-subunit alcohol dehydrogenase family)
MSPPSARLAFNRLPAPDGVAGVSACACADHQPSSFARSVTDDHPSPISLPPADDIAERARQAAALLEQIATDRAVLARLTPEDRMRLLHAAGEVSRPDALARRRLVKATRSQRKQERVQRAESVLQETGIRRLRREEVFITPKVFAPTDFVQETVDEEPEFQRAPELLNCYICKRDYTELHHFYDQLCPSCAAFNFAKRTETADLSGRVALLTGGRVKIGYQAGIKLLRAGAHLIVTTRFPRDSAVRYAAEPDFEDWADRLEIFGLDLRHTPSVEAFCAHLVATRERLDFIVNNACQTVRRPPEFYQHMMEIETAALHTTAGPTQRLLGAYEGVRGYNMLPEGKDATPAIAAQVREAVGLTHAAQLSQVALLAEEAKAQHALFPVGRLDQDLQQVDLRDRNSWRMQMDEVPSVELLEVHLVNAVAPFLMNARLKPLMLRAPGRDKHIVNVSAVEGQFYRRFKTTRHPHTNMAKAALNMMTRTSAPDYVRDGIHMNSVDTGWVTDEDPVEIAARKTAEHRFHPPLDIVDGAARIVDPIIAGVNSGQHVWGQFLKDYVPVDW